MPGVEMTFNHTPGYGQAADVSPPQAIVHTLREQRDSNTSNDGEDNRGIGRSPLSRSNSIGAGGQGPDSLGAFSPERSRGGRADMHTTEPVPYNPYTSGLGIGLGMTPLHNNNNYTDSSSMPMTVPATRGTVGVVVGTGGGFSLSRGENSFDDGSYGSSLERAPSFHEHAALHRYAPPHTEESG
jgi:hypothetical protein